MFDEDSNFIYVFGILIVGFAAVRIFYHFKFKRDTRLTEFDKSLWEFKFASVLWAVLIYGLLLYLPSTYYPTIQPEDSQEQIVRQLVRNQQDIAKDLSDFRQIFFFLMLATGGYIGSVGRFISKLQKERQKVLIENDPELKKPLGL